MANFNPAYPLLSMIVGRTDVRHLRIGASFKRSMSGTVVEPALQPGVAVDGSQLSSSTQVAAHNLCPLCLLGREAPKALIKLDKKPKTKTKATSKPGRVPPTPSDPAPYASPPSSPGNPHRNPSLSSLIGLRRKSTLGSQSLLSSSSSPLQIAHADASAPSSYPLPQLKHAPSLCSYFGSEPALRLSDKANRLLGQPLSESPNTFPPPGLGTLDPSRFQEPDDVPVSEFSGTFQVSPHSSPGEDDSYKDRPRSPSPTESVCSPPPSIIVFTTHTSDADTLFELDIEPRSPREHVIPVAINSQALVARGSHTREPSVVRKERNWVGEWNQGDMQTVIQKLRSLK
ncbi:hypothetical protein B0H10DRAFT_2230676 [Mycena sp. CBHHK59/15]|nr:hypothetical protein B0H10DRAFT_2230676 [Mycena sp. CBHHK59/15]